MQPLPGPLAARLRDVDAPEPASVCGRKHREPTGVGPEVVDRGVRQVRTQPRPGCVDAAAGIGHEGAHMNVLPQFGRPAGCHCGERVVNPADALLGLVAKGVMGGGVFETDDIRTTCEELKGNGVTSPQEPADRPYGIEALFRDDSGNWFSLNQHKRYGG